MLKTYKTTILILSAFYILLGLVLIIWPSESKIVMCYIAGAAATLLGVISLIMSFARRDASGSPAVKLITGIVFLTIGLILLCGAKAVVTIVGILIGIALIINSIMRFQASVELKSSGASAWFVIAIVSAVMFVLGVILLFIPYEGMNGATIVSGVSLVLDGIFNLWSVLYANKKLKYQ